MTETAWKYLEMIWGDDHYGGDTSQARTVINELWPDLEGAAEELVEAYLQVKIAEGDETDHDALTVRSVMAIATPNHNPVQHGESRTRFLPPYAVIVLNDDYHTFEYVIDYFAKVFGHSQDKSYTLAKEIHVQGRGIVWSSSKEVAELRNSNKTLSGGMAGPTLAVSLAEEPLWPSYCRTGCGRSSNRSSLRSPRRARRAGGRRSPTGRP